MILLIGMLIVKHAFRLNLEVCQVKCMEICGQITDHFMVTVTSMDAFEKNMHFIWFSVAFGNWGKKPIHAALFFLKQAESSEQFGMKCGYSH